MHRVLVPPRTSSTSSITITDPATLHHLHDVLRVAVGEPLECFDGSGRIYRGTIARCAHGELTIAVASEGLGAVLPLRITLAQALIKPERFEWVLEKATELGVARIVPMVTMRATVRPAPGRGAARLARWRRIAEAAATQCGRATVPAIEAPEPFAQVLERCRGHLAFLPTLIGDAQPAGASFASIRTGDEVVVLIGPEGDFSPEEVRQALQHGLHPVRLGPLTLRSETAAMAILTLLQHAAGLL